MAGKSSSPAAHGMPLWFAPVEHHGAWSQLFQPGALTATGKQGTQNKARDVTIGSFTAGTQLSSESYHDTEGRHGEVLPNTLLRHRQQHAFIFLGKLRKYAFFILFSPPSTPAHLYSVLYTIHLSGLHKRPHSHSTLPQEDLRPFRNHLINMEQ